MSLVKPDWKKTPSTESVAEFWRDAGTVAREVEAWPVWKRGEAANEPEVQDDTAFTLKEESDIRDLLGRGGWPDVGEVDAAASATADAERR